MATYIAGRPVHQEARGGMKEIGRRRTYLSSAVFARWTRFFVQSPLARTGWEGDEEEGAEDGAAAPVAIARGSVGFAGRADEGFWGDSPPLALRSPCPRHFFLHSHWLGPCRQRATCGCLGGVPLHNAPY